MPTPDVELVSSRILPFPPSQVYGAFADPSLLAQWWGPHGSRNEIHEFDLRPGGTWRFTMSGPWGTMEMTKRFDVVEHGRRIVLRHEQEGHTFTLDMAMIPEEGETRLSWRTTFKTSGQLAAVRQAFAQGNEENFDRLVALLSRRPNAGL